MPHSFTPPPSKATLPGYGGNASPVTRTKTGSFSNIDPAELRRKFGE
jgi:hypothetical protein